MLKSITSILVTILLSCLIVTCSSAAEVETETNSTTDIQAASSENSASSTANSEESNSATVIEEASEEAIALEETESTESSASSEGATTVTYVRETIDPETGEILSREVVTLEAILGSEALHTSGSETAGTFESTNTDTVAVETADSEASETQTTESQQENIEAVSETSSETEAEASSGIPWYVWLIGGILVLVIAVVCIYAKATVGRLGRFTSLLNVFDMNQSNEQHRSNVLTAQDQKFLDLKKRY